MATLQDLYNRLVNGLETPGGYLPAFINQGDSTGGGKLTGGQIYGPATPAFNQTKAPGVSDVRTPQALPTYGPINQNAAGAGPQVMDTGTNLLPQDTLTGGSTGSAGSASTTPTFSQYFGGNLYTDYAAYLNSVNSAAQTEFSKQLAGLDKAYQNGLITFQDRQHAIDVNRQNIQTQATNLLDSYKQSKQGLQDSLTSGLQGIAGSFARLAPDAVQSEQGVLTGKAQDQYTQGVTNLDTAKSQNDTAIAQSLDNLGTQQRQLGTDQSMYTDTYNQNKDALGQARNQSVDSTLNSYLSYLNPLQAQIKQADVPAAAQTVNAATTNYNIQPYLSALQGLQPILNKGAGGSNSFAISGNQTPTNQATLDSFLNPDGIVKNPFL